MPLLAGLISTLFSALGAFLVKLFVAKLAIRIAAVAAIVAAGTALMTAFNGFVSPLVAAMFSSQYGQFLGLAVRRCAEPGDDVDRIAQLLKHGIVRDGADLPQAHLPVGGKVRLAA